MTPDSTITPSSESDLSKMARGRQSARAGQGLSHTDLHPEMMGDETEEQNLGQTGDPAARIGEQEVQDAFGARPAEPRSFQTDGEPILGEKPADRLAALAEKVFEGVNTVRSQVQQSAEAAKAWAAEQAKVAQRAATEKPALVISASAGAALAAGLALGFILGRLTAED
jgi:ElaB/YqjD/DUF883 family membrane-anchored ribosome-binding protein